MIESNNEVSKDLEKALQALEQAKQRVVNEKKRKAENHHKYILGGISDKGVSADYIERELQNESRQHDKQQSRTNRREEEI